MTCALFLTSDSNSPLVTGSCAGCSDETIRFLLRNDRGGRARSPSKVAS